MKEILSSAEIENKFIKSFSENFQKRINEYAELIACFDQTNFTERQSYGLVVASLMKSFRPASLLISINL